MADRGDGRADVYVTDEYRSAPRAHEVPPRLRQSVKLFRVRLSGDDVSAEVVAMFGGENDPHVLRRVDHVAQPQDRARAAAPRATASSVKRPAPSLM